MTVNVNQYIVSVADVQLRDPIADVIVLKGKTLINSSLKQSMATQEVRSGFGNALQFVYQHDKKLDVSIEDSRWDESYLALNNGASIVNGSQNLYIFDEVITLSAGNGTLANTPVGNIYVQKADNSVQTITPTGSNFSVAGGASTIVKVSYRYNTSVDSIIVDATQIPNTYELIMTCKVFQAQGQTAIFQVVVPNFRISGNFDLNLGAASVATSKLDGIALVDSSNAYAYVYMKPVNAGAITYQAIAAIPSNPTITVAAPTVQITSYGIRGGLYSNVAINASTDCTYVSGTPATCTVSASGLITRVAAGTSLITVTQTATSLKDYINVTAT